MYIIKIYSATVPRRLRIDKLRSSSSEKPSNQEADASVHKDRSHIVLVKVQKNADPNNYSKSPIEEKNGGGNAVIEMCSSARNS